MPFGLNVSWDEDLKLQNLGPDDLLVENVPVEKVEKFRHGDSSEMFTDISEMACRAISECGLVGLNGANWI